MKITHLGNFSPYTFSTEKLIKKAFEELGHEVIPINEQDFSIEDVRKADPDLFLFHKGTRYGKSIDDILELLNKITCKKAFWFFDCIEGEREKLIQAVTPFVDKGFMTDGSWLNRKNYTNLHVLRQGTDGEGKGEYKKEHSYKVGFIGSIYNERARFAEGLKYHYGDDFKVFSNVWGKDFRDVCASCKVLVSPRFPMDDNYWSNRIYTILGAGGFLIHPRLHGLKEELVEDKHYVAYNSGHEMKTKIDYYLKNPKERKRIANNGYKYVNKHYTYIKRCQELLNKL